MCMCACKHRPAEALHHSRPLSWGGVALFVSRLAVWLLKSFFSWVEQMTYQGQNRPLCFFNLSVVLGGVKFWSSALLGHPFVADHHEDLGTVYGWDGVPWKFGFFFPALLKKSCRLPSVETVFLSLLLPLVPSERTVANTLKCSQICCSSSLGLSAVVFIKLSACSRSSKTHEHVCGRA